MRQRTTRQLAIGCIHERRQHFQAAVDDLLIKRSSLRDVISTGRDIVKLVEWYLPYIGDPHSPRRGHLYDKLWKTERTSERLRRLILTTDRLLSTYGHAFIASPLVDLDPSRLLPQDGPDPELRCARFYHALVGLEALCRTLRGRVGEDRGGNTNLHKLAYGDPKRQLFADAADLFAKYRPNDLKGTDGGPLYRFCGAIYTLVSGIPVTRRGVGLKDFITFAAPQLRKRNELLAEKLELDLTLMRRVGSASEYQKRDQLGQEADALYRHLRFGEIRPRKRVKPARDADIASRGRFGSTT